MREGYRNAFDTLHAAISLSPLPKHLLKQCVEAIEYGYRDQPRHPPAYYSPDL